MFRILQTFFHFDPMFDFNVILLKNCQPNFFFHFSARSCRYVIHSSVFIAHYTIFNVYLNVFFLFCLIQEKLCTRVLVPMTCSVSITRRYVHTFSCRNQNWHGFQPHVSHQRFLCFHKHSATEMGFQVCSQTGSQNKAVFYFRDLKQNKITAL